MVNPSAFEKRWIVSSPHTIDGDRQIVVRCHQVLQNVLHNIWLDLIASDIVNEVQSYNGCFCIRNVRGVQGLTSLHAWGLAIDLNAATNQIGKGEGDMSAAVVQIFRQHGMFWGGDFQHRKDPMHFELTDGTF
jgi:hypothetical protein